VTRLPPIVLLDLDDTILHFSAEQPDFWAMALREVLAQAGGSDDARAEQWRQAIEVHSDEFWSEPGRAAWGRQHMYEARRRIARSALTPLGVGECQADAVGVFMTDCKERHVRPFDGAVDKLERLRQAGHRLALLTNGSSRFQRRKLERFGLSDFFEVVLVEGELGFGKPDERVFRLALQHLGARPEDCCMVGDNLRADVGGAQGVGIAGIWNDVYARGLPADSGVVPKRIIRRVTEL